MKLLLLSLCITTCYCLAVKRDLRCGSNTPLTTDDGVITSHAGYDHGHHYGKNLNCVWTITAPAGQLVELVADNFSVSYPNSRTGFCSYDYLKLYDGDSINAPVLGTYCGKTFNPISSTQRSLTLKFHTTSTAQYDGFRIRYNFTNTVVRTCANGTFQCDNLYCISNSFRCDEDDDCGDDSDERNCAAYFAAHTCPSGKFACPNTIDCISRLWLCDGDSDCKGGTDEAFSLCGGTYKTHRTHPPITCDANHFACHGLTHRCIPNTWVCDGYNDCHDSLFGRGSDESNCGGTYRTTTRRVFTFPFRA